jgi:hypothetical protein
MGHLKGVEPVLQLVLQLLSAHAHAVRTVMGRRSSGRAQRWTRSGFKRAEREERVRPEERAARDQAAGWRGTATRRRRRKQQSA